MVPLDQPGDDRDVAEGALQHRGFGHPRPRGRRPACPRRTARRCRAAGSQAPDREHVVGGDEAERRETRRAPSAASAACPASGARCGPRSNRRPGTTGRRAGRSRPAARPARGSTERRRCSRSHSRTAAGRLPPAPRVVQERAHPLARARWSAAAGRRHRSAPWAVAAAPRHHRRPCRVRASKRSIWPANMKVSPGGSVDEVLLDLAQHRPRRAAAPCSIGASTMVPMFIR